MKIYTDQFFAVPYLVTASVRHFDWIRFSYLGEKADGQKTVGYGYVASPFPPTDALLHRDISWFCCGNFSAE